MIPSGRLVALLAGPMVLAMAYPFTDLSLLLVAAADGAVVALALGDLLTNRATLSVRRRHDSVQSVGVEASVSLELDNQSRRGLTVAVMDDAPGRREGLPAEVYVAGGARATVAYGHTVSRRGRHRFGPVTLRWRSPLGLWWGQRRHAVEGELHVYPDFRFLRRYGLKARQDDRRVPVRARRRPGGENEFQRLRPYVSGDPYRHIDWKASARKQHFVTREYGQESNQNVVFLLDAGRNMTARLGELSAFDHALNAALAMGHVALRHGDRVGMLVFDRSVRAWLPPRSGKRTGTSLIRGTYDLFPSMDEPDYAVAFRHLSRAVRRRCLVVLLTAVQDEVASEHATTILRALGSRHLPLVVWLQDPSLTARLEAPATSADDLYRRGAAAELVGWRERSLAELRRRGALVVDCPPDALGPEMLGTYLEVKARRLL